MPEIDNDLLEAQKAMFNKDNNQKELITDTPNDDASVDEVIENLSNLDEGAEKKEVEEGKEKDLENLENLEGKKAKKEEKKNWRDAYKDTDDYKEEVKQKDLAQYEAKMKELQEIENDEAYKIIVAARKQGKNPLELMKEIATADYDKLNPKDLFMKKLDKYKDKLSEDEIEAEIDAFDSLTPLQKIESTESIKNELIAQRKEQLAKFESKPQETPKEVLDNFNKFTTELDSIMDKLEGKTYKGVKWTPTLLAKLDNAIRQGKVSPKAYVNHDGTFDAKEALEVAMSLREFRDLTRKQELKAAESKGKESVLKDRSNVSKGVRTSNMPNASDNDAELKAAQKAMFNK